MFTIKAGYSDDIEVRTSVDKVREFFLDVSNFAELMPGVLQIHTDAKGVAHWRIQAEIPLVGSVGLCGLYQVAFARLGASTRIIDATDATLAGLKAARQA